eukprot:12936663-Prorocentrum_lima.AAC.1
MFLRAENNAHRRLHRQVRGWSEELYRLASVPMWTEIAQLHGRLCLPFDCWPWRLSSMSCPTAIVGERRCCSRADEYVLARWPVHPEV